MRKATICLAMLLCSLAANGQQQPQWKVVQSIVLLKQTAPIPVTTLFTPTAPGMFRVSAEITPTNSSGTWFVSVLWKDQLRPNQVYSCYNSCDGGYPEFLSTTMMVSKDSPIQYYASPWNEVGGYNLFIVLEQLE